MNDEKFVSFLEQKTDAIYAAAHTLACTIAAVDSTVTGEEVEEDMQYIGEIADAVEEILANCGLRHCYPYFEGDQEVPCYRGHDCTVEDCLFKSANK